MKPGMEQVRKTYLGNGRVRYDWIRWAETGAIQAWGEFDPRNAEYSLTGSPWIGGIECHAATGEGEPSHDPCWVLGGRCWHDGSSLQFSEDIALFLPRDPDLREHHHQHVLSAVYRRLGWLPAAQKGGDA